MAKDRARSRLKTLSIIALCCSFVACISLIIALATDHWQDIEVDRSGLLKIVQYKPELQQPMSTDVLYYDRHRGLLRQCLATPSGDHVIPEVACSWDMAFGSSPVLDLTHVTSPTRRRDVISALKTRNALVVMTTALMAAADVCALFACVIGLVALFVKRRVVYTAAMSVVFAATVSAGSAMAIFHGLDFLERTELVVYTFPAAVQRDDAYNELGAYTTIRQGCSYYFGWAGVLLTGTAAILFLHVNKTFVEKLLGDRHPGTPSISSTSLFGGSKSKSTIGSLPSAPSNAYDMMESSTNTDVSEIDSSRASPSDDWNPYNELPRDYD